MEERTTQKQKKMNNKGFSLVELIIVIAIMAILVGIVGTQVLPYIERSRESKDVQVISSVCTAAQSAISSSTTTVPDEKFILSSRGSSASAGDKAVLGSIADYLGYSGESESAAADAAYRGIISKLKSKIAGDIDSIVVDYNSSTGAITVTPKDGSNSIAKLEVKND